MSAVQDIVDIVLPVTPAGAVENPDELSAELRTPSILNPLTPQQVLDRMDRYGISQSIVPARKYGEAWTLSYEAVRDFVAAAPTRLFATAGISPLAKMEGVRRFEEAVRDFDFIGAHAYTSWARVPIDHRLWYPYFAKAEELEVPFQIEIMGGKTRPSGGRPKYLDQVAEDFPHLNLIATHTGYPWERELVGICEFRKNVYIGFDTLMPHLWAPELIAYARDENFAGRNARKMYSGGPRVDVLPSDRILFGTNYLSMDIETVFDEVAELGLSDHVLRKLYTTNARNLYNLPGPT